MGMVVRTNTMALNAYRQLGMNNSAVSKSLEKLSSGFRINRAGDDAAGLAISEKMKAQIKGLETASSNAQDGISLIQTAEGNLNEVHDMLNRMVELATKSANGTYTSQERGALQDEVNSLLEEIDRISQSANFNGTNLLDGSLGGINTAAFNIGTAIASADGAAIGITAGLSSAAGNYHTSQAGASAQNPSFEIDLADFVLDTTKVTSGTVAVTISVAGKSLTIGTAGATGATYDGAAIVSAIMGNTGNFVSSGMPAGQTTLVDIGGAFFTVSGSGSKLTFTYAGMTANGTAAATTDTFTATQANDLNSAIANSVSIAIDTAVAGATSSGDVYHAALNVDKAIAQEDTKRAGIKLDLSLVTDLYKDGATFTIDGTTFTILTDPSNTATAGANDIDLRNVTGVTANSAATAGDYAKEAAIQLSNKSTTNFEIGESGNGVIHVDQKVGNTAVYSSYDDLVKIFSGKQQDVNAAAVLTVNEGSIKDGDILHVGDKAFKFVTSASTPANSSEILIGTATGDTIDNLVSALTSAGYTVSNNNGTLTIEGATITTGGLTLQIGDTAASFNKMNVSVADMSAKGLGLKNLQITSEQLASDAIDKIKNAINTVSNTRAGMGALQNRLEHTINNLDVAVENLSAANSRIRDTDMAKEMMNYTKMNVLVQSAQAMLAQANQQPQSVLQLLQ